MICFYSCGYEGHFYFLHGDSLDVDRVDGRFYLHISTENDVPDKILFVDVLSQIEQAMVILLLFEEHLPCDIFYFILLFYL